MNIFHSKETLGKPTRTAHRCTGFFLRQNRYNSPVNIVTALETLSVEGLQDGHDHIIETVLSKLFIRGDEVHKAYKHRVADFANLTHRETRRAYISEDFFWNNVMAPEIYLELRHVLRDGNQFIHVNEDDAEDWYIVMKKIDSGRDLLKTLEKGEVEEIELREYAKLLTERLRLLTNEKGKDLSMHINKGTAHISSEVLGVCDWASVGGDPHLSYDEVMHAKELLSKALEREKYFHAPISLSVVIDTNPDNIIFLDEGVSFIDVMPPKDSWRVHDRYFPLCRTSADIAALSHRDHAEPLHHEYGKSEALPPETVRVVYELAAALIQVPYRKMVGRDDLAAKYADFVRAQMQTLEQLLAEQPQ